MAETDVNKILGNLPDNSHKARAERANAPSEKPIENKRVPKVIKGNVKTKKNNTRKLTDVFISEDIVNVKDYIIFDVIVPAIKKSLYDIVVNSLDMSLFGGRGGGSNSKRTTADRVSYRDYNSVSKDDRSHGRPRATTGYSYDDIIFDRRSDAEAVLSTMDDMLVQYDRVTVADMYDICQLTPNHTDNKYGWKSLSNARVVSLRDGRFTLDMPRVTPV